MKKTLIILFVVIALAVVYKFISNKPSSINNADSSQPTVTSENNSTADVILFWGQGCPHCENVKKYITNNKIDEKVKIDQKEVYNNKQNQQLLEETVKKCPEIDTQGGIGVPLAFINSTQKCLIGDQPIIDYLQQKTTENK